VVPGDSVRRELDATARPAAHHDYPPFKYIVSFEQSLASFLLARGPFAWFGYSCECDDLPSF
jgi:hypothetical protein